MGNTALKQLEDPFTIYAHRVRSQLVVFSESPHRLWLSALHPISLSRFKAPKQSANGLTDGRDDICPRTRGGVRLWAQERLTILEFSGNRSKRHPDLGRR